MATSDTTLAKLAQRVPTPRLQNGDYLSREEFERRYDADPSGRKAELLEGVVYMASPVRQTYHSQQHFHLNGWLFVYRIATPVVEGGDNASLRLELNNEPQPDGFLYVQPAFGGQVKIDDEGYIVVAPELVAEVSASTLSYDLHKKLEIYRSNGVKEYIVWRVEDHAIDWFGLNDGGYQLLETIDGIYRSRVFPGLWLDAAALLQGDLGKMNRVLQEGISSLEHAAFLQRLQGDKPG